jgi:hypothetical protein
MEAASSKEQEHSQDCLNLTSEPCSFTLDTDEDASETYLHNVEAQEELVDHAQKHFTVCAGRITFEPAQGRFDGDKESVQSQAARYQG